MHLHTWTHAHTCRPHLPTHNHRPRRRGCVTGRTHRRGVSGAGRGRQVGRDERTQMLTPLQSESAQRRRQEGRADRAARAEGLGSDLFAWQGRRHLLRSDCTG